jgi:superoxide dismutase
MIDPATYNVQSFDLSGLKGISEQSLEVHFELYKGYVTQTNSLKEVTEEAIQEAKQAFEAARMKTHKSTIDV